MTSSAPSSSAPSRLRRAALEIEPGLLYVFRLFLTIQWALLSLAMCGILSKPAPIPDYESAIDWIGTTLLVGYLAWSWLRRRLGRLYLPIALIAASLGPVGAQVAATALRIEHGLSGTAAVAGKLFTYVRQGTPPSAELTGLLTEREREILRLLASGLTNAAIAGRLSLAEGTVRNHVTTILAKLEVADRAQATALAWRYGLANLGDDAP